MYLRTLLCMDILKHTIQRLYEDFCIGFKIKIVSPTPERVWLLFGLTTQPFIGDTSIMLGCLTLANNLLLSERQVHSAVYTVRDRLLTYLFMGHGITSPTSQHCNGQLMVTEWRTLLYTLHPATVLPSTPLQYVAFVE